MNLAYRLVRNLKRPDANRFKSIGVEMSKYILIAAILISGPAHAAKFLWWYIGDAAERGECEYALVHGSGALPNGTSLPAKPPTQIPTLDGKYILEATHAKAVIKDLNGLEKFETSISSEDRSLTGYYNPLTGTGIVFTIKGGVYRAVATPVVRYARLKERDQPQTQFTAAAVHTDESRVVMVSYDQQLFFYDFNSKKMEIFPIVTEELLEEAITEVRFTASGDLLAKDGKKTYLIDSASGRMLQVR